MTSNGGPPSCTRGMKISPPPPPPPPANHLLDTQEGSAQSVQAELINN